MSHIDDAQWNADDRPPRRGKFLVTYVDAQNQPPRNRHVMVGWYDGAGCWSTEAQIDGIIAAWMELPQPFGA